MTILKYDWIGDNWYVRSDSKTLVCDRQFVNCHKLFTDHSPKGMALDPTRGLLFFTSWDDQAAAVMNATMAGEVVGVLTNYKVIHPHAITLDLPNERVYWVDSYMNYIEGMDYTGRERVLIKRPMANAFLLYANDTVEQFEDKLFVTQTAHSSILSIDRHNFELNRVAKLLKPSSILTIFHAQRQPMVSHPCRTNKGGCEHICVPTWRNSVAVAKCLCHQGYSLDPSGKCRIVSQSRYIVYSTPYSIVGISTDFTTEAVEAMPPIITHDTKFDVSARDGMIFFLRTNSSTGETQLYSRRVNGTTETLLRTYPNFIRDIAYDWIGDNIYAIDDNAVSVFSVKNVSNIRVLDFTQKNFL